VKARFHIVVLASLLVVLLAPALRAQTTGADCSYLVAGHSYANTFAGFMNTVEFLGSTLGNYALLPNAGAGVMTFQTGGTVKNTESMMIADFGVFPRADVSGTYSLKWDTSKAPVLCTGTAHLTGVANQMPLVDDFQLTVTPDGQRVEMIHTNAGLIVQTITRPAEPRGCRNSTIAGAYTYSTAGWAIGQFYTNDPAQMLSGYIAGAMSGAFQFYPHRPAPDGFADVPDGASALTAWDTLSINGGMPSGTTFAPVHRKMTGWYKVDPRDCSGTMVVRDDAGNPDFRVNFYIGKDGKFLAAVNVNNWADLGGPAPIPVFVFPIPFERADPR